MVLSQSLAEIELELFKIYKTEVHKFQDQVDTCSYIILLIYIFKYTMTVRNVNFDYRAGVGRL